MSTIVPEPTDRQTQDTRADDPKPLSECLPEVLAQMIRREASAKRGDR